MKNQTIIQQLGIEDLPKDRQDVILRQVTKTLNLKVGMALADALNDDQLVEFQAVVDKDDEQATEDWLAVNYPDYENLIPSILEETIAEIKQTSAGMLSSNQQE